MPFCVDYRWFMGIFLWHWWSVYRNSRCCRDTWLQKNCQYTSAYVQLHSWSYLLSAEMAAITERIIDIVVSTLGQWVLMYWFGIVDTTVELAVESWKPPEGFQSTQAIIPIMWIWIEILRIHRFVIWMQMKMLNFWEPAEHYATHVPWTNKVCIHTMKSFRWNIFNQVLSNFLLFDIWKIRLLVF